MPEILIPTQPNRGVNLLGSVSSVFTDITGFTSTTLGHFIPQGTDVLLACCQFDTQVAFDFTATCMSQPMKQIGRVAASSTSQELDLFFLLNPPAGNATVIFSHVSTTKAFGAVVYCLSGVQQQNPYSSLVAVGQGTVTSIYSVLSDARNEDLVCDFIAVNGAPVITAASSRIQLANFNCPEIGNAENGTMMGASIARGAGLNTTLWTFGASSSRTSRIALAVQGRKPGLKKFFFLGSAQPEQFFELSPSFFQWQCQALAIERSLVIMPAQMRWMAQSTAPSTEGITFDSTSTAGYQTADAAYTWSHTCAGNDRYLTVGISMLSVAGSSVSGITYDGVPLILIRARSSDAGAIRSELWGLVAPNAGTHDISVTLSAALDSIGNAVSFAGVNQAAPHEAGNDASATNVGAADATVNVTTVADNDWTVDVVATTDTAITVGTGQTQRQNGTGALGSGAMSTESRKTPPGAVTMSWTDVAALATWTIVSVAIRPNTAIGATTLEILPAQVQWQGQTVRAVSQQTLTPAYVQWRAQQSVLTRTIRLSPGQVVWRGEIVVAMLVTTARVTRSYPHGVGRGAPRRQVVGYS